MKVTGEELNKCACEASRAACRMYDIIRDVGYGRITADNALHRMIEDIKNLRGLSDHLQKMSDSIPWDGEEVKDA